MTVDTISDLGALEQLVFRRRSSLLCDREREIPAELVGRLCGMVVAAPNHKRTFPWELAVFVGDARRDLGEALGADLSEQVPDTPAAKLDKTRTKYLRAPAVVVAGCRASDNAVRHREDTFAVAAGLQNLLLGATAIGLSALWSSPPVLVAPRTNRLARFEPPTELVGLVYLGWPTGSPPDAERPPHVLTWIGRPSH